MARQLQALTATLTLDPKAYRLRAGQAVGACPRSDTEAVAWEQVGPTNRLGLDELRAGFEGRDDADRYQARATLAQGWATDADYDTGANGPRTARTWTLEAAGVRAWLGLELAYVEPDADTSVLFRLYDGDTGDELYWTGAEWAAGTPGDDTAAEWNTGPDLQAGFPSLPGNVRRLAVLAWLRTDTKDARPGFYGARVAYAVRQVAPLDDALIRTLLASLRAELRATGVMEWETEATTASVELVPAGLDVGPDPFAYQVTGVDAVFNLTDDPDELTELPGSFAGGTWTPTTPIPAGKVVRLEFRYVPDLVARRHQDVEALARLPAIYLAPSGPPALSYRPQGAFLVRNLEADPPTALELPDPELVTVPLELRVVAELGADVERLAQALTTWLATRPDGAPGLGQARELVSPETGQVVQVRATSRPVETPALLAQGVAEARASWLLTFARASAHTVTTAPLVNEAGPTLSVQELTP